VFVITAITTFGRAVFLRYLPGSISRRMKSWQLSQRRKIIRSGPSIDRTAMRALLLDKLQIKPGNIVFVHHSIDLLNLTFSASELLNILRQVVGPDGTLVFPSFPSIPSYEVLETSIIFDCRRTPGYTGLLGEMARRIPGAHRSVHPIRSVVALGPAAAEITGTHHLSKLPYDKFSPFYKLYEHGALVVGLGVSSRNLTFVHVLDDLMPNLLPFDVYRPKVFSTQCINAFGAPCWVAARAHDPMRMRIDVAAFLRRYVDARIAEDLNIGCMRFFRADARLLLERMTDLAKQGKTIYQA
jgi:aminoglycoside 3-N-acetyltransferase